MFASAGTFTSCKDYDDDISGLQEQINTVKADLESLESTVANLDGVKTLSFANGTLTIETGKGTKVEVPVPEAVQLAEIELKDNVLYVNGENKGEVVLPDTPVTPEPGESQVVEVKDGKLYIDGVEQPLELGDAVAVVANNDRGTYTLSVNGTEYELPMAVAEVGITILSKKYDNDNTAYGPVNNAGLFTEFSYYNGGYNWMTDETGGINWAVAAADNADWGITKGDLLVGQINTIDIAVLPVSYDLTGEGRLTLRDSNGKIAPVTVTAVANTKVQVLVLLLQEANIV